CFTDASYILLHHGVREDPMVYLRSLLQSEGDIVVEFVHRIRGRCWTRLGVVTALVVITLALAALLGIAGTLQTLLAFVGGFFPLMVEVGAVYVTDYLYPCAGCGRVIDAHSYRHAVLSDGMVFVGLEVEFDQILGAATADQKIDGAVLALTNFDLADVHDFGRTDVLALFAVPDPRTTTDAELEGAGLAVLGDTFD